ncbi:hypothetical protein [Bryobacter aggregatus]|uniref:hypothetical protein n=1 Tax=Bryobacter aggregatus TaxID=360054 RepID=UPI0004E28488|nr:hypothetical protein [Bryobacter aggregatus]
MALLKDQPISCLTEWMAYDSKLSILSAQETTSIEAKSCLAQNEIETQVTSFLLRHSGLGELAARQLLSKVTVTEALHRWHSMLTLSLFYADLASLQNSALHREQSRYYETKADAAQDQLFDTGLGIVNFPISKAPVPLITSQPGTNPLRILRGRIRYLDGNGAMGAPSSDFLLDMSNGQQLTLALDSLPDRVIGWLLYVGDESNLFYLATASPVTSSVTLTAEMLNQQTERLDLASQAADRFIRYSTELWR